MTDGHTVREFQTPIGDSRAFVLRAAEVDSKVSTLAWLHRGKQFVAFHGRANRLDARWVADIDVEHLVTADEAHITANGPCCRTRVVESPGLAEHGVWSHLCTVGDSVADKECLVVRHDRAIGLGNGLAHEWLGLNLLYRLAASIYLNGFLLLNFGLVNGPSGPSGDMNLVTQGNCSTQAVIAYGAHSHIADGSVELDQRMSAVVVLSWKSLAARTEVGVITDSALVANSADVILGRFALAQRTVTEDAIVDFMFSSRFTNSIVNLHEPMSRVALRSSQNAFGAEVPIGAG